MTYYLARIANLTRSVNLTIVHMSEKRGSKLTEYSPYKLGGDMLELRYIS